MSNTFTLERFESCVASGQADEAIRLLCELNEILADRPDFDLLTLAARSTAWPPRSQAWQEERFVSRLSAGLVSLLGNTTFVLTEDQFTRLAGMRSRLQDCLAAAPLSNADHVARKFLPTVATDGSVVLPFHDALKRLNILCNSESRLSLDYSACFQVEPVATLNLAIAIAGEMLPGSAEAHRRREALMDWLAQAISNTEHIEAIEIAGIIKLYMCCTYAEIEHRHAIKRSINQLVRNILAANQLGDLDPAKGAAKRASRQRPLMLVVLEAFNDGHSILRTHSLNLLAARAHFDIVAICDHEAIGVQGREVFTRVIEFERSSSFPDRLDMIRSFAETECPDVLYMPCVGMSAYTLFVSNMRMAPLQIAGLGHPATTHSDCIDYISVEDDYVGDPSCFSETLLRLPKDGQPYRPSTLMQPVGPRKESDSPPVVIAIAASLMKLSPSFLRACSKIAERSNVPIHFQFMTSGGSCLTWMHLCRVATRALPGGQVSVFPGRPYMDYIHALNDADMFLSPFPFGNTNGIVDAFSVGLPGVCKTGREVFERIDGAMFMRAYMPGWLVADTEEEYIEAAVRLANNRDERESLRQYMLDKNVVQRFFEGRPEVFGEMVLELVNEQRLKTA